MNLFLKLGLGVAGIWLIRQLLKPNTVTKQVSEPEHKVQHHNSQQLIYCDCGFHFIPIAWCLNPQLDTKCVMCGNHCSESEKTPVISVLDSHCNQLRYFNPKLKSCQEIFQQFVDVAMCEGEWSGLKFEDGGRESLNIDVLRMKGYTYHEATDMVHAGIGLTC